MSHVADGKHFVLTIQARIFVCQWQYFKFSLHFFVSKIFQHCGTVVKPVSEGLGEQTV